jgi:hypothetical protein
MRSIGCVLSQEELQSAMIPSLVSADLGLLDGSGATIAALLRNRYGLPAQSSPLISFDQVAARAGQQPIITCGRRWYIDPVGNTAVGHCVAVRSFDGTQLILANPGGTGPRFGQQALDRDEFAERGPFMAVIIDLPPFAPPTATPPLESRQPTPVLATSGPTRTPIPILTRTATPTGIATPTPTRPAIG